MKHYYNRPEIKAESFDDYEVICTSYTYGSANGGVQYGKSFNGFITDDNADDDINKYGNRSVWDEPDDSENQEW